MHLKAELSRTNAKLYDTEKKLEEKVNSYKALMSRVRAWEQTERRKGKQDEKDSQREQNIPGHADALKAQQVHSIQTHTHSTGDVKSTLNRRWLFNNIHEGISWKIFNCIKISVEISLYSKIHIYAIRQSIYCEI